MAQIESKMEELYSDLILKELEEAEFGFSAYVEVVLGIFTDRGGAKEQRVNQPLS
jgi:hypothetical protein